MMVITFLVLAGGTALFWYLIYRQYRPIKRGRKEKKTEPKHEQPETSAEKQTESPKLKMEEFEHA